MLVLLSDRHKQDLRFFHSVPPAVLAEFAKLALEFLKSGANPKAYAAAGRKLEVGAEEVRTAVEALSQVFAEAARHHLSQADFVDSLLVLAFPPAINEGLGELYGGSVREVRSMQAALALHVAHYEALQWRLDVQVASRALERQVNPLFTLRLETLDPASRVHLLQADYTTLDNVCKELEAALQELKSSHCRRIMRNVK